MIPGEYRLASEPVVANPGRPTVTVEVTNSGDRPIQVGPHYHFLRPMAPCFLIAPVRVDTGWIFRLAPQSASNPAMRRQVQLGGARRPP